MKKINQRLLGNTGISVSEIAFGGVEIGIPYGIGVHDRSDMLSHSDAIKLLHAALDGGINLFDTARLYGESELIMGKAFQDRRDQVILSTKCKHFRNENGSIPPFNILKKTIEDSLHESLGLLRTDYADVFMLHQADLEILESEDVSRIFSDLKSSGIVRATGASTYTTDETRTAIESGAWDVVQLPFNLMDQRQQKLFSLAEEKGVALVIRSVLLKGLLSSKGRDLHPALKDVEEHVKKYSGLIKGNIPDLPTLAAKFALSFKEVTSVLVGIDRHEYLIKSLEAADGHYLSESMRSAAMDLEYPEPEFLDLPKWDRLGWLK
jgi:aryl-alcohol dehydrogenase-like predicted oxidoreductase